MVASVEPLASCFVLTDNQDPRYRYLFSLKNRLGLFLKKASEFLREQGDENIIDAVQILVSCLRKARDLIAQKDFLDSFHENIYAGLWRQ